MKVEVAVLGSTSLISFVVTLDVKQLTFEKEEHPAIGKELCESRVFVY